MTATMHVICLKETGHVLAALAATTEGAAPDLAALVGDDLPLASLRSTTNGTAGLEPVRTYLPQSVLELKSVPLDEGVVANPFHYAIDGDRVVRLPAIAIPGQPANRLDNARLLVDGGLVDTVAFTAVGDRIDPVGTRRIQSGKFVSVIAPPAVDQLSLALQILPNDTPATIPDGTYDIFIALEGHRPFWGADIVP
jgi:hypothetical protein